MSSPLLTPEEHRSCVEELDRLRERLQEDNAAVDARIAHLEDLLRDARVVERDDAAETVALGRAVEVEYLRTGNVVTLHLTGIRGGSGSGTVSARSPIGAALLGRAAGAVVAVELPNGRVERLRILAVHPPS